MMEWLYNMAQVHWLVSGELADMVVGFRNSCSSENLLRLAVEGGAE